MVNQIIAPVSEESSFAEETPKNTLPENTSDYLSQIVEKTHEIKTEMAETPVGLDNVSMQAIDEKLREKVTALGHLIGSEAERRINFSHDENLKMLAELEAIYLDIEQLRDDQATSWVAILDTPAFGKIRGILLALETTILAEKEISSLRLKKLMLNKYWFAKSRFLADSYKSVLSEIRPLGGELKTRKGSSFIAARILKNTVENTFPQDWIEVSNKAKHSLRLKFSRHGGFYEPKPEHALTDEKGRLAMVDVWEAPIEDAEEIKNLLSEDENHAWITNCTPWEDDGHLVAEINYYSRFEPGAKAKIDGMRIIAKGKRFFGYAPGEDEDFPEEKTWYQNGYIKGSEKDGLSPVLNISFINSPADQTQTAYHEFMHHMQSLLPHSVLRLERAFSFHRTSVDGVRNPLHEVDGEVDSQNKSEVFYRDGKFVDPYMGREYPFSNDLEIITTGTEALFGRAYGSLLGFHGWQADIEHRNFTLGVFAVA